jgi:hypothetical protein
MGTLHSLNRILRFLVILFVLGIAGLEMPELLSLTNDTSNDPEAAECVQRDAFSISSEGNTTPGEAVQNSTSSRSWPTSLFGLYFCRPQKSAQDTLRLIAVQRE